MKYRAGHPRSRDDGNERDKNFYKVIFKFLKILKWWMEREQVLMPFYEIPGGGGLSIIQFNMKHGWMNLNPLIRSQTINLIIMKVSGWQNVYRTMHCIENPIYVFPEMKLYYLIPNSYIHVSVCDTYTPRIGQSIWLQKNRKTDPGNIYKSFTDPWMLKLGDGKEAAQFHFSGNT